MNKSVLKSIFSDAYLAPKKTKNKLIGIKGFFILILFMCIMALAFMLNLQHEEYIIFQQKMQSESIKAVEANSGIVVDAAAAIIVKEGNVLPKIAKKYAIWIYDSSAKYGVDPTLILAVMAVESSFDYKVVSSGNAIGLLQVIHSWHKEKTSKVALFDPKNNINVGTQILKEYSDRSSSDIETLLRYNGSLGTSSSYAKKVLSKKVLFESIIVEAVAKSL